MQLKLMEILPWKEKKKKKKTIERETNGKKTASPEDGQSMCKVESGMTTDVPSPGLEPGTSKKKWQKRRLLRAMRNPNSLNVIFRYFADVIARSFG